MKADLTFASAALALSFLDVDLDLTFSPPKRECFGVTTEEALLPSAGVTLGVEGVTLGVEGLTELAGWILGDGGV